MSDYEKKYREAKRLLEQIYSAVVSEPDKVESKFDEAMRQIVQFLEDNEE